MGSGLMVRDAAHAAPHHEGLATTPPRSGAEPAAGFRARAGQSACPLPDRQISCRDPVNRTNYQRSDRAGPLGNPLTIPVSMETLHSIRIYQLQAFEIVISIKPSAPPEVSSILRKRHGKKHGRGIFKDLTGWFANRKTSSRFELALDGPERIVSVLSRH